jgi:hypothetical protein
MQHCAAGSICACCSATGTRARWLVQAWLVVAAVNVAAPRTHQVIACPNTTAPLQGSCPLGYQLAVLHTKCANAWHYAGSGTTKHAAGPHLSSSTLQLIRPAAVQHNNKTTSCRFKPIAALSWQACSSCCVVAASVAVRHAAKKKDAQAR